MIFYKVIICLAGFFFKYMTSEGVRVQPIYEFQTLETYIFDLKKISDDIKAEFHELIKE